MVKALSETIGISTPTVSQSLKYKKERILKQEKKEILNTFMQIEVLKKTIDDINKYFLVQNKRLYNIVIV